jgi:predicted RNA-binding protein YlxR (DUF448 family)
MRKESHSGLRTCLGCMHRDLKTAMVRIVDSDGTVVTDLRGALPGRGGYLHASEECLERFARSRVKEFRSLHRAVDRAARERIAESIRTRLDRNRGVE